MNRLLSNLWGRYVWGERTRHQDIDDIFRGRLSKIAGFGGVRGIYLIGCGDRIVYIGQSINISHRSIESLARFYHQIDDITLPWSIGLAPVTEDDKDLYNSDVGLDPSWEYTKILIELESTAIRKFAPIFNTSIPSKLKSKGKEPNITHIARVFADQDKNCTAFDLENLEKQAIEAESNPSPPWHQGNKIRRKRNPTTNKLELIEKYKEG